MTRKMKAAYLTAPGRIDIRETPVPEPGPGEVLVRIKMVGVCGSDVHYFQQGKIGDQVITKPFILGHEAAGIVALSGPGAQKFRSGDRVAVEPAVSCGKCPVCLKGKPNLCRQVRFLGTPPVTGAFREYLVMPEANLLPLPEKVSLAEGVLAEPLAIGLYAVNLLPVNAGDRVAVLGCGPIGLSIIFCARLAGATAVLASEPIPQRIDYALKIGADRVFNPEKTDPVTEILKFTGGEGVTCAFEAAGKQATLAQCVEVASLAGKVAIVGIPQEDTWTFPSHAARRKELFLFNVRRSAFTTEQAIELIAAGKINPRSMITHRFPLEKTGEALETVAGYRDGVIKAVVEL